MDIQVLVATMHQTDHSLLEKMNIKTDAIIGNQCDHIAIEAFEWNGNNITYLNFAERGVGLNRNNALMRASAEICLFADDDVVYYDNYAEIIEKEFIENPKADVIVFNMKWSRNGVDLRDCVHKKGFIGRKKASSYGTYLIGFRSARIKAKNIVFHRMFGGGTEYSCGEDTIFLQDCIKKGLKVYRTTSTIGIVYHGESTWFKGYTDKFFYDKGVLYKYIYPLLAKPLSLYHVIKHRKMYSNFGIKKAFIQMWKGTKVKF
ncbi:MAG: glycosyltransferase family 2 protein [Clostridia bacterium]|nr:glycosyltransferase family 2 protein [Clostridia bacterium]